MTFSSPTASTASSCQHCDNQIRSVFFRIINLGFRVAAHATSPCVICTMFRALEIEFALPCDGKSTLLPCENPSSLLGQNYHSSGQGRLATGLGLSGTQPQILFLHVCPLLVSSPQHSAVQNLHPLQDNHTPDEVNNF